MMYSRRRPKFSPEKRIRYWQQPKRTFDHELKSRAAVTADSPTEQTTVLNSDQLKQCGYAYINNGIVRGVVDRRYSLFRVRGQRR